MDKNTHFDGLAGSNSPPTAHSTGTVTVTGLRDHSQNVETSRQRSENRDPLGPGYLGVEGNEQANRTAKAAPVGTGARRCAERFTSVTHISRSVTERKRKEAKH